MKSWMHEAAQSGCLVNMWATNVRREFEFAFFLHQFLNENYQRDVTVRLVPFVTEQYIMVRRTTVAYWAEFVYRCPEKIVSRSIAAIVDELPAAGTVVCFGAIATIGICEPATVAGGTRPVPGPAAGAFGSHTTAAAIDLKGRLPSHSTVAFRIHLLNSRLGSIFTEASNETAAPW